jgi:hypothetical protein
MSIEQWLSEATPERREVKVCFDRRLLSQLNSAQDELTKYPPRGIKDDSELDRVLGDDSYAEREAAEELVHDLEEQVKAKTRTLVFEGVGWGIWRELIASNPPQEDQDAVFKRAVQLAYMPHALINIGFNAETFVPAAIVASCVEPGLTSSQAKSLLEKSPPGVLERIWTAVLEVNTGGGSDPFS